MIYVSKRYDGICATIEILKKFQKAENKVFSTRNIFYLYILKVR